MAPALVKAHAELDRAAVLCYRLQPFTSERQRAEYLLGLYEQLIAPLLPAPSPNGHETAQAPDNRTSA